MKPAFRWTCSYQGLTWFQVTDETGTYEAELRRTCHDYELERANGDAVREEMKAAVGILRRSHCKPGDHSFAIPPATVAAFNEWRAAEHAAWLASMRAQPDRYGEISDSEFPAPMIANPGRFEGGHWHS